MHNAVSLESKKKNISESASSSLWKRTFRDTVTKWRLSSFLFSAFFTQGFSMAYTVAPPSGDPATGAWTEEMSPSPETDTANELRSKESPESISYRPENLRTERTARQLFPTFKNGFIMYGLPTLFGLGLICNLLSFLVILKSQIRKTSTGVYLCVLAWADLLSLAAQTSVHWAYPILGRELPMFGIRAVRQFIVSFSPSLGAMSIVCVTVDRFMAVWLPFQAKSLTTRKRAMIVMGIVILSLAIVYSPALMALIPDANFQLRLRVFTSKGIFIPINIFYSYGPIIALFCLNTAIAIKLALPGKMVKEGGRGQMSKQTTKTIATVLSVSFTFIIATLPMNILFSLTAARIPISGDPLTVEVFWTVGRLLHLGNHSLNFFLYILTSSNFRNTFIELIKAPFTCCGNSVRSSPPSLKTSKSRVWIKTFKIPKATNWSKLVCLGRLLLLFFFLWCAIWYAFVPKVVRVSSGHRIFPVVCNNIMPEQGVI